MVDGRGMARRESWQPWNAGSLGCAGWVGQPFAGPGHWNDPDMLEVGNGEMTTTEMADALQFVGDLGRSADGGDRLAKHDTRDSATS